MRMIWSNGPAATMHLDNFQSLCVALFSRLPAILHIFRCDLAKERAMEGMTEPSKLNEGMPSWQMGVDPKPKKKADDDYKKRTAKPLDVDPSQATFVFVTPHRWPGKENWAAEKRKTGPWRNVRAFDADDLATWLALAPEVHVWISRLVGKDPGNVRDLESFWLDWQEATHPPLSAELIIAGH